MAGSLLPDTHRFEEKVIREYLYPILGPIRPQGLGEKLLRSRLAPTPFAVIDNEAILLFG
jgi:hypothetical protein